MIPFIAWRTIELGTVTLQVWGIFVALGFLLGGFMAARFASRRGDDPRVVWDVLGSVVLAGLLGHVILYEPSYFLVHPLDVFKVWQGGMSMFGGLVLAIGVLVWQLRKRHVDVWRYADVFAFGLPFGKWIGRIGCFLIHDHPGTATDFFLGVQYPDGTIRHDLGLYLSLDALLLGLVMLWLSRKPQAVGTYVVLFALWYGATRFGLDFLRVGDIRYVGLTPAQYGSAVLVVAGVWIMLKRKHGKVDRLLSN